MYRDFEHWVRLAPVGAGGVDGVYVFDASERPRALTAPAIRRNTEIWMFSVNI